MLLLSLQTNLIFIMSILYGSAVKPPGYIQPSKAPDPNPPKYEYGYKITDEKGSGQGKQEQRDGIYALGRYYVQEKDSNQDVQYFADDWGYHPVVEYSSVGPNSRSNTKFALGTEAVQQLKNKENNLPQLQGIFNGNERLDARTDQNIAHTIASQSQDQIFTNERQLQDLKSRQQQDITGTSISQEGSPHIDGGKQVLVTPILLAGEVQGKITESQIDNKTFSTDGQLQVNEEAQSQIQDINQKLELKKNNIAQLNKMVEESLLQQETNQNTFNHSEQNQIHRVILKHQEPVQQLIFPQQQVINQHQQENFTGENTGKNVISDKSDRNFQTLFVQFIPEEQSAQFISQSASTESQGYLSSKENQSVEGDHYESAALYQNYDQLVHVGGLMANEYEFGSKIPPEEVHQIDASNKLIEHTKNLVTGEDVLNINKAINNEHIVNGESSTAQTSVTDFDTSKIVSEHTLTNFLITHSDSFLSTPSTSPVTEVSFNRQPIVVEDFENNSYTSETTTVRSTEVIQSSESSSSTLKTSTGNFEPTSPRTILVTPRPISSSILAPITAGVQLQNIDIQNKENKGKEQYKVEIQKSLPFYLGKFEYPSTAYSEQLVFNSTSNETNSAEIIAAENIELGKTLLIFPGQNPSESELQQHSQNIYEQYFTEVNNDINVQQLPVRSINQNFNELDQQQAQGHKHQVVVQQSYSDYVTQRPNEVTKVIHKPYPVKVPYEVPYPVVKQVQIPVTVKKIIEKPIHVTKYVEKPVPIPQPYPVQKVIEKPVHVPIQVTKYVDRPYPVEVRIPYPQPYPVEKVVQKIVKQPYPVEVRVPVPIEKIVEKKVPVPQFVEKPVEKIVEKPVPQYIDRPYPVEVKLAQPYIVQIQIPKPNMPINKFNNKPLGGLQIPPPFNLQTYNIPLAVNIPQNVQFAIPVNIYDQNGYSNKNPDLQAQQSQHQQTYIYPNAYAYAPQVNQYLSHKQELPLNNGYLPAQNSNYYPLKKDCNQHNADTNLRNYYYKIKPQDYIGLLPPRGSTSELKLVKHFRTARSNFDEKNIRMEYGFMPPLIPSLEIDEQGNPIDKSEK